MSDEFEFDLDNDNMDLGDLDNFDVESEDVTEDRNPVLTGGEAAINTVAEQITSPERVLGTIKENLPKGYASAWNSTESVVKEASSLYNEAVKDVKPAMREMARNTKRLLPGLSSILPEKVNSAIDDFIEGPADNSTAAFNADEAAISNSLGSIFAAQAQNDENDRREEITQSTIRNNIQDAQFTTELEVQNQLHNQMARIAQYNEDIDAKVSKQSLELQFRQFFTLRDLLEITKRYTVDSVNNLQMIVKNTGLPDLVKFKQSENMMQQFKDSLYGERIDDAANRVGTMTSNLMKNLKLKAKEKATEFKEGLAGASDGVGMFADMSEMQAEMGMETDYGEMAGEMGGGVVADKLFTRMGKWFGDWAEKNQTVANIGDRLTHLTSDSDGLLNSLTSSQGVMGAKLPEFMRELIMDNMNKSSLDAVAVTTNIKGNETQAVSLDAMMRKSIVDIMPDYLSRILDSINMLRGEESNRLVFNPEVGHLTTINEATKAAHDKVFDRSDIERKASRIKDLVDLIDVDNSLNPEAKMILGNFLQNQTMDHRFFDPEALLREFSDEYLPNEDLRDDIETAFKKGMGIDEDDKLSNNREDVRRRTKAAQQYVNMRSHVGDMQNEIIDYNLSGSTNILREANILTQDGNVTVFNQDMFKEMQQDALRTAMYDGESKVESKYQEPQVTNGLRSPNLPPLNETNKEATSPSVSIDSSGIVDAIRASNASGDVVSKLEEIREIISAYRNGEDVTEQLGALNDSLKAERERKEAGGKSDFNKYLEEQAEREAAYDAARASEASKTQELIELLKISNREGFNDVINTLNSGIVVADLSSIGKGAFGKIKDKLVGTLGTVTKYIGKIWGAPIRAVKKGLNFLNKINPFKDVSDFKKDLYVPGEQEPRLYGNRLKMGHYFLLGDDVPFRAYSKIDKAVVDQDGQVLITEEEVAAGLAYSDGSLIKRTTGIIKDKLYGIGSGVLDYIDKNVGKKFRKLKNLMETPFKRLANWNANRDIYIRGVTEPILRVVELKAGRYFDKDGNVIKSFADLSGNVYNAAGELLLSSEDIGKLIDVEGRAIEIRGFIGSVVKIATAPFKIGYDLAIKGINYVKDKAGDLSIPKDIYIPGMDDPIIRAKDFVEGKFFDKETGKPIFSPKDITGAVVDKYGKVILSVDDIKKGLFHSVHGKFEKIKSIKLPGTGGIKDLLLKPFRALKDFAGGALSGISKTLGLDKLFAGVGNIISRKVETMNVQAGVVNIYTNDLRNNPDGGPDGSGPNDPVDGPDKPYTPGDYGKLAKDKVLSRAATIKRWAEHKKQATSTVGSSVLDDTKGKVIAIKDRITARGEKMHEDYKARLESEPESNISRAVKFGSEAIDGIKDRASEIEKSISGSDVAYILKSEADVATKAGLLKDTAESIYERKRRQLSGSTADTDETDESAQDNTKSGVVSLTDSLLATIAKVDIGKGTSPKDVIEQIKQKAKDAVKVKESSMTGTESKAKKTISGDTDGDGMRDGSYRDIIAEKAAKVKASHQKRVDKRKVAAQERTNELLGDISKTSKKNLKANKDAAGAGLGITEILGGIAAFIGGGGLLAKIKDWVGLGGGVDAAADAVTNTKKPGLLRRMGKGLWSATKAVGSFAGKAAWGATKFVAKQGARAVVGAATKGLALAAGVSAGAAMVAGSAAIAVGAAGYYGYKYTQRRKAVHALEAVRFAQYGIDWMNQDEIVAIRYLEDKLEGDITKDEMGISVAEIVDEYAEDFGVNPDDAVHIEQFTLWIAKRFLPVYRSWLNVTESLDTDVRSAHSDIDTKAACELAKKTMFGPKDNHDPYSIAGPFKDKVLIGKEEITNAINALEMKANKDTGKATVKRNVISGEEVTSTKVVPTTKDIVTEKRQGLRAKAIKELTHRKDKLTKEINSGKLSEKELEVKRGTLNDVAQSIAGLTAESESIEAKRYAVGHNVTDLNKYRVRMDSTVKPETTLHSNNDAVHKEQLKTTARLRNNNVTNLAKLQVRSGDNVQAPKYLDATLTPTLRKAVEIDANTSQGTELDMGNVKKLPVVPVRDMELVRKEVDEGERINRERRERLATVASQQQARYKDDQALAIKTINIQEEMLETNRSMDKSLREIKDLLVQGTDKERTVKVVQDNASETPAKPKAARRNLAPETDYVVPVSMKRAGGH